MISDAQEQRELPEIVRYYTETSLSAGQGINSTVFKFFEKDGTSYYAYYYLGRSYYPYLAKSSDGENFEKFEYSELESLSLPYPYAFKEIVFLDDFQVTEIDTDKIRNAE